MYRLSRLLFILLPKIDKMQMQILKKISLLIVFIAVLSCSGDDQNPVNPIAEETPILIKKVTETIYFSGENQVSITDFVYEDNRLISSTSRSSNSATVYKTNFNYNGDKVSQAINYSNDVERTRNTYLYNGDFLTQIVSNRSDQTRTDFFYSNGMVATRESGYVNEGNYEVNHTENYTFNAWNRIEERVVSNLFGTAEDSKTIYTFDAKNNPTKYMNKYLRYLFSAEGFDGMSQNNMASRLSYWPAATSTPKLYTYQFIYNENDFPTEIKQLSPEGTIISLTKIEYQ